MDKNWQIMFEIILCIIYGSLIAIYLDTEAALQQKREDPIQLAGDSVASVAMLL